MLHDVDDVFSQDDAENLPLAVHHRELLQVVALENPGALLLVRPGADLHDAGVHGVPDWSVGGCEDEVSQGNDASQGVAVVEDEEVVGCFGLGLCAAKEGDGLLGGHPSAEDDETGEHEPARTLILVLQEGGHLFRIGHVLDNALRSVRRQRVKDVRGNVGAGQAQDRCRKIVFQAKHQRGRFINVHLFQDLRSGLRVQVLRDEMALIDAELMKCRGAVCFVKRGDGSSSLPGVAFLEEPLDSLNRHHGPVGVPPGGRRGVSHGAFRSNVGREGP